MPTGDHYTGHSNFVFYTDTNATAVLQARLDAVTGGVADISAKPTMRMVIEGWHLSSTSALAALYTLQWVHAGGTTDFLTLRIPAVGITLSESMSKLFSPLGSGLTATVTGTMTLTELTIWGRFTQF